jgi:16S rRNA G527 N7-methylase RsmG
MFHVKHLLKNGLKKLKITPKEEKLQKLTLYIEELLKWNKKINLVSRNLKEEDIIKKLILPSLIPHKIIKTGEEILDFGAGAGIVGIPLSIIKNKSSFTLLESKTKPLSFLRHMRNILSVDIILINKYLNKKEKLDKRFDKILIRGSNPEKIPSGLGNEIIYYGEYKGDKLKIKSSLSFHTFCTLFYRFHVCYNLSLFFFYSI